MLCTVKIQLLSYFMFPNEIGLLLHVEALLYLACFQFIK